MTTRVRPDEALHLCAGAHRSIWRNDGSPAWVRHRTDLIPESSQYRATIDALNADQTIRFMRISPNGGQTMSRTTKYFPLLAVIGLLAVLAGCASTETQSGTGEYIDDTVITTKVKAAIFNDSDLTSSEINVETFKGVVQLSGFVSTQEQIDRAIVLARDVAGVESVVNSMRLR